MLNKLLVVVVLFGAWQWWSQRYKVDIVDFDAPNIEVTAAPMSCSRN
ncbi:MAG: hypothetical protein U5L02_02570 [Rheinheimera sp.]|nr:hypothetical protein [Rheinheimera sp.]